MSCFDYSGSSLAGRPLDRLAGRWEGGNGTCVPEMRLVLKILSSERWGETKGQVQSENWVSYAFHFRCLEWQRGWDSHHF
jgi:hypothetical protein